MELESSTAVGAHNGLPRLKIVGLDIREIEAIAVTRTVRFFPPASGDECNQAP
jgi:hypothetical protein